ncbi:MAG: protein kinase [Solirubrobacterales bacterium]|nr:protein kinase [Solirubrobacterales bacterium]
MSTLIKERYEVLELLGIGGEGRVVKALDRQHDRIVTLKIRPVRDGQAREELLGEARILLAIPPHPALPLVREDFFDGEDYVVAMDWVEGTDLATLLRDRGRPGLAPSSVLAYLAQAAQALTHLHSQVPPVIHGDVKPANLILTTGGRLKLVDFGISSAPNALRRRVGTPGFRAPELAAGGAPSRASDVYALAATAFALLTGSAPAGVLPSWEGIDPTQAKQLETAIRVGMATDPARRPATPGELVERLRAGWAEALPTGVVTFCLSDIEGSSAVWDSHPEAMAKALVRHDELIAECVEGNGGSFLKSIGESTVSIFHSAPAAIVAALGATRALSAEPWPEDLHLAARFGIHTGEAERRETEYLGPAISLAAQLRDQADGGQIFLSSVTTELVEAHLPAGCELVDLGPHRLPGLGAAERIHAIKAAGIRAPLPATDCPYRGLLAFEPENRDYFFGREAVVAELIARLAPGRLVAVVGASGSGKSSVLRAGLIGAVRAGEVAGLEGAQLRQPGSSPRLEVDGGRRRLLVVDQFEELFTLCEDAGRRDAFVAALLAIPGPVAIGMRADMYGKLGGHPALARAVAANQVLLGAMTGGELERAVTKPAQLAGLRLEPGLAELARRDVAGEPGALPLLSHALRATWERRNGRTLTVEGYRDSGGVASAIAQTADSLLASLPAEQRQIARGVFLRLTELGEAGGESRRRVAIDELVPEGVSPESVQALLERLAAARLVTLDEGTAEVAHEVLIREWPTLRGWLDEDREGIRLHRQLGTAARLWDTGGRDPSDLYRGARLGAAVEWAEPRSEDLNATERSFIDAGIAEADRERRAQLGANRRLRALLAGAVGLLIVAALAGLVALIQRGNAQAQALTSDAERLGALAQTEPNLDRALLLAVAGVKLQNRVETRSDLLAALQRSPALIRVLRPSRSEPAALQVSPDGRLLALADTTGEVRFIDTSTWRPTGSAVQLPETVAPRAMSFSADSRTLMVIAESTARSELDDIEVPSRRVRRLHAWGGEVPPPPTGSSSVAYSPDGRHIAVSLITQAPTDPTPSAERLLMLDSSSGRIAWQRRYPMHPMQLEPHLAFASTDVLLTSAQQGETILWNAGTGRILRRFPIGGLPALSAGRHEVALGRNSPNVATPTSSVAVLDLQTGVARWLVDDLPGEWIVSIAFTRDGSKIVAQSLDGSDVFDVASGTILETYTGQPGRRALTTVDPRGATVISAGQDGSIALFDLSGSQRLGRFFAWNQPSQSCPNSPCEIVNRQDLMATDQADGTIALVDLHTLRAIKTLPARNGAIANAISFLPDGRTLLTGGSNRRVIFWDLRTDRVTRTLRFAEPVWWTAVSPDAKLLAVLTQAADSTTSHIQVLDIATGRVFQNHLVPHATPLNASVPGNAGLEFSRDGRELAALGCCSSGSAVIAWDVHTGAQLFGRTAGVEANAIDLAPDSRLLGVGTADGNVLLLDPRTGRQNGAPIQVAAGHASALQFSPDDSMLAVGAWDGTASIWDLRSRKRLGNPFPPYPGAIPTVVFEPNGRLLIVPLANAFEWPTNVTTWERFACRAAGRALTPQEWHDLLPGRAYQPVCPNTT